MHLQRIVLPSGHITWTAYDGDAIVTEIREFVIYLEARHHAPSTVAHYARHVVRLGNYLAAMGKSFRKITPLDLDRFASAVSRRRSWIAAMSTHSARLRNGEAVISVP